MTKGQVLRQEDRAMKRHGFLRLALVVALLPFGSSALAQSEPTVGDSGPSVGDFQTAPAEDQPDPVCTFPSFTDDSYVATLGEDERGRFIDFIQTSTGDSGVFRMDESGNLFFETEGDEAYEEIETDGDILKARYTYTTGDCSQVWQATVTLPPGFVMFLRGDPRFAQEEPPSSTTTTTIATSQEGEPPAVVEQEEPAASPATTLTAQAVDDETSGGIPWFIWLILLILLAYLIWFSTRLVGGGKEGRAPGDNGDDPRDTPPPDVYGEEFETFIIKYCFYIPPDQLRKAAKAPSKSVVSRRTKARKKQQKLIDRNAERLSEDEAITIDEKHRKQIGAKGTVDRWIDAIYWWQEQINAQCVGRLSIDAVLELKPIETEGLTDDKGKTLPNFAKTEKSAKEKASWRWVIGRRDLDARTRHGDATRTHFHISLFKYVRVKTNAKTDGIIFALYPNAKPPPFANFGAVLRKPQTRGEIHEVGHLFGLEHGDGGVMNKRAGSTGTQGGYGNGFAFDDAKCRKVIHQLKGS